MTVRRRLLWALAVTTLAASAAVAAGSILLAPWLVAVMVPAAMVLLAGLGYTAVRRLSSQVEGMADAVERSAAGELHLEPPRDGDEEIDRLGEAVRRTQRALLGKVAELEAERTLMASVIAGMHEGLLLVGPDRRIRLSNAALRGILQLPFDPQGRKLAEVVRHPAVIRDVETALSNGVETDQSIVRVPELGRCFELRVVPLAGRVQDAPGEALVLFFDVTRLERLENVRREFMADVSHELRTPLTSIKAFVETLLDERSDDPLIARRFLEIVRKHADRMSELIADLTDLSLIETGAIRLELAQVDAERIARDVAERLQPLAEKRSVQLTLDIAGPFPIHADRRRLEQMLSNLLDNAIKFSSAGGRVWIRGATGDAGTTLSVKDEGIGIPAASQEKVFHRFYQEDRARSREAGGTGLGLAIVKHLMRLHGGSVRVESELGQGSEFSLEFPAVPPA